MSFRQSWLCWGSWKHFCWSRVWKHHIFIYVPSLSITSQHFQASLGLLQTFPRKNVPRDFSNSFPLDAWLVTLPPSQTRQEQTSAQRKSLDKSDFGWSNGCVKLLGKTTGNPVYNEYSQNIGISGFNISLKPILGVYSQYSKSNSNFSRNFYGVKTLALAPRRTAQKSTGRWTAQIQVMSTPD